MASENIYRQTNISDTGTVTVIEMDAARRTDVLFRVRRDEGHEVNAWWLIGAFVASLGATFGGRRRDL